MKAAPSLLKEGEHFLELGFNLHLSRHALQRCTHSCLAHGMQSQVGDSPGDAQPQDPGSHGAPEG